MTYPITSGGASSIFDFGAVQVQSRLPPRVSAAGNTPQFFSSVLQTPGVILQFLQLSWFAESFPEIHG